MKVKMELKGTAAVATKYNWTVRITAGRCQKRQCDIQDLDSTDCIQNVRETQKVASKILFINDTKPKRQLYIVKSSKELMLS